MANRREKRNINQADGSMSKLFNLKEWLTVRDAARHLSIAFGEDVTDADVLRLGLDGRLRLSVHLVNHARARRGNVVGIEDVEWFEMPTEAVAAMPNVPDSAKGAPLVYMRSLNIDGKRFLNLSKEISTLRGVWDLPMIGNETLDVEHEYQSLTGGPAVTLQGLDGAFVEGRDGQICQLQESFDANEFQPGSSAELEKLRQHIAEDDIRGADAESLLHRHAIERKKFLETKRTRTEAENYYPAGGLPKDAVIVVRTEALREFERNCDDTPLPDSHAHVSDKLARMNQASAKFWSNADRDDRGTHPDNATVANWLVKQGFSPTLADKAATIIRPEWAPSGRKPEE